MKLLRTLAFSVPVIGWMLKSAWHGDAREKTLFLVNLVMIWALAILYFGYPALILPALVLAGSYLAFLVVFTAGDFRNGR